MSKDEKKEIEPIFGEKCFQCIQYESNETFCYKYLIQFKNICEYPDILA